MKLSYVTPLTFPSRFVNRLQVMKMSAAFAKQADFRLYIAKSRMSHAELFQTYNIHDSFRVEEVGNTILPPRRIWQARKFLPTVKNASPDVVWYIRDILLADWLLFLSSRFASRYFFELHTLSRFSEQRYCRVLSRARGIITTNDEKKKDIMERFGMPADRILVAPNAVDVDEFLALRGQKEEYKKKLGFAGSAPLVVYTGTDKEEYGTGVLRQAARLLGDAATVQIISGRPRREALEYMAAADVLVAPYLPANEHFRNYMSPMKIREYMAMERPIVVSDLPSIHAYLPEDAVYYVPPGDAAKLADAIRMVCGNNAQEALQRTQCAFAHIEKSSWGARAKCIIDFMEKLSA